MGFGVLSFEDFDAWIKNYCFPQDYYYDPPLEGIGPINRFQRNVNPRFGTYCGGELEYDEMMENLENIRFFRSRHGKLPEDVTVSIELKKKINSFNHKENKIYHWYTIVTDERMPYTAEYIRKWRDFAEDVFETSAKKWFKETWWVVESGKHINNPNLHLHALVEFKNSKHFRRDLLRKWKKYVPEAQYNITHEKAIDMKTIDKTEYIKDKLDYMNNSLKGTHENFTDLGVKGRWSDSDC